jgi:hypothetical protein
MSAPGEYDDKDVTSNRPDRAGSTSAGGGEYDDKDVVSADHDAGSAAAEADSEPEGSFVDKDVEPRAATERGKGEYDDKDR